MSGKLINEVGKRYDRWTVVKRVGSGKGGNARWLCRCDCGTERGVFGTSLRSGQSRSCGCFARERANQVLTIDLTDQVFGKLTVLEKAGRRHDRLAWLCRCDCGNEVVVTGDNLRSGGTRSCGCLRMLPKGEAAFNVLIYTMKCNAGGRGLEWQLSNEQVQHLTQQNCHYCRTEPSQLIKTPGGVCIYNGLDRVDNDKGYTIDNVVPCCKVCNGAKGKMPLEEFRLWVAKLCEHFLVGEKKW